MKPDTTEHWQSRIERARQLIEARLDQDVPLEDLARAAHASRFHFHRVFRGLTGETVREYARRLRLQRAAHRLTHASDADILSVALEAGYDSHEAFTRAFKRHFGVTPSAYRHDQTLLRSTQGDSLMVTPDQVRIEHHGPRTIAYVRHVGPYAEVGDAWRTLMIWGWSKMMFRKPDTFGLCYDDPETTPADQLRYDACMVVKANTKPKGKVQIKQLPETTYAVVLHAGPLEKLSDCYAGLFACVASEQIEGRRWELGDPPSLERYLTDPRKVAADQNRTEVCMPVVADRQRAGSTPS